MRSKKTNPSADEVQKHKQTIINDSQSAYNEAQQTPANSGDPRTSNSAVNSHLPYGEPTDDLHPITQPEGDVSKDEPPVGSPRKKPAA
jgi:hypothetical protein